MGVEEGAEQGPVDVQLHVADEAAGEVQEGFGKARRKVGEAIEDIGEGLKK